jgi:hypothetical protein
MNQSKHNSRTIFGFLIFAIALLLYLSAGLFLTDKLIKAGGQYKNNMLLYADTLSFTERLLNGREWLLGNRELSARANLAESYRQIALEADVKQADFTARVASLSIAFALLVLIASYWSPYRWQLYTATITVIALICLINGLFVSMLEIGAFNENLKIPLVAEIPLIRNTIDLSKEFPGRIYYYYQNKSVADLIATLFQQKNYLVGLSITIFSVVIPLIKLTLTLFLVLINHPWRFGFITLLVRNIGKWSMADVFVAASFLSYLSFNNMKTGINTEANALLGLNFFLAYCLLSIASVMLLNRAINQERDVVI